MLTRFDFGHLWRVYFGKNGKTPPSKTGVLLPTERTTRHYDQDNYGGPPLVGPQLLFTQYIHGFPPHSDGALCRADKGPTWLVSKVNKIGTSTHLVPKKCVEYTSILPYVFRAWCLFTLTLFRIVFISKILCAFLISHMRASRSVWHALDVIASIILGQE
jgi:hypothetical protein